MRSGSSKMAQPVTLPLTTLLSSNKPLATVSSPLEQTFPDLTRPDAYVWGILKENIIREDPPSTIVQLKEKITMGAFTNSAPLGLQTKEHPPPPEDSDYTDVEIQ
ncbi:hypothetical protein J6590_008059 [Homalodisca vitripennis]|nr:hypothetical protein J6590_008059 [Homalodisca vitripennis]